MGAFPFKFLTKCFCLCIALCGVVMYNYLKIKDGRAVQLPVDGVSDRIAKV